MQQTNSDSNNSVLNTVKNAFKGLIASKGGYFSDSLYSLDKSSSVFEPTKKSEDVDFNPIWLIVGRQHYFETTKEYPIANLKDVKQAIELDDSLAPFDGVKLYKIERVDDKKHRATLWVIPKTLFENFKSKPLFVFPESYLFSLAIKSQINTFSIELADKQLFVSKNNNGLYSAVRSQNLPSLQSFVLSTGNFSEGLQADNVYQKEESLSLLRTGLKKLLLSNFTSFVLPREKKAWRDYPWRSISAICILSLTLYLAGVSSWLVYKDSKLSSEIEETRSRTTSSLSAQKAYQKELSDLKQLNLPIEKVEEYWQIWPLVILVGQAGTEVRAIQYKNQTYTLRGTSAKDKKATEVLAQISEFENVTSASFSQPVREYRGREEFVITLKVATDKEQSDSSRKGS